MIRRWGFADATQFALYSLAAASMYLALEIGLRPLTRRSLDSWATSMRLNLDTPGHSKLFTDLKSEARRNEQISVGILGWLESGLPLAFFSLLSLRSNRGRKSTQRLQKARPPSKTRCPLESTDFLSQPG